MLRIFLAHPELRNILGRRRPLRVDIRRLRPDCSRCAALCCVALAFARSPEFAIDKPAASPCPYLRADHRCRIHSALEARGFPGCTRYDCLGAGQRVVQELFAGRSWREHPELSDPMFTAFRALREVHELLLLLHTAARLPLTADQERQRRSFIDELDPTGGWSQASLTAFEQGELGAKVRSFLRTLRAAAAAGLRPRRALHVV